MRELTLRYGVVRYGLRYISGNRLPYFSVTFTPHSERSTLPFGACHDYILRHAPELADIVALHMSSPSGVPMYAVENGWYWLSNWNGKGTHTGDHGLEVAARYLRCDPGDLADVPLDPMADGEYPRAFKSAISRLAHKWREEADAVINKYNLHGWDTKGRVRHDWLS